MLVVHVVEMFIQRDLSNMPIKYLFHKGVTDKRQNEFMRFHIYNIERDINPTTIRQMGNSWFVSYKVDGMSIKETNIYVWSNYLTHLNAKHHLFKKIEVM